MKGPLQKISTKTLEQHHRELVQALTTDEIQFLLNVLLNHNRPYSPQYSVQLENEQAKSISHWIRWGRHHLRSIIETQ